MGLQWLLWWPCCCLILTLWLLSWDLIPGRKAPGCTCLVRMPHCLPHALQAWDHAALYSVLFSQCPSGMISHNVKYNFQVVGCMMACAVDIWSLWCWKALGCYWSSLFFRDSEDFFLAAYLCLWLLLIIALAESWKQICWDKGHTYIYDKSSPKRLKKFTHLAEVLKT